LNYVKTHFFGTNLARAALAHRFQISVLSRCTAMLAGLRTLIHTQHGPDRYMLSTFDTMPSAPRLRQANSLAGDLVDAANDRLRRFGLLGHARSIGREPWTSNPLDDR
jgi:hypothetical protein